MTNGSNVYGDGHAAEHITRILEEKLAPSAPVRVSETRIAAFDLMH